MKTEKTKSTTKHQIIGTPFWETAERTAKILMELSLNMHFRRRMDADACGAEQNHKAKWCRGALTFSRIFAQDGGEYLCIGEGIVDRIGQLLLQHSSDRFQSTIREMYAVIPCGASDQTGEPDRIQKIVDIRLWGILLANRLLPH